MRSIIVLKYKSGLLYNNQFYVFLILLLESLLFSPLGKSTIVKFTLYCCSCERSIAVSLFFKHFFIDIYLLLLFTFLLLFTAPLYLGGRYLCLKKIIHTLCDILNISPYYWLYNNCLLKHDPFFLSKVIDGRTFLKVL